MSNTRRGVSKIVLCCIFFRLSTQGILLLMWTVLDQDAGCHKTTSKSLWLWERRSKLHIPCTGWTPDIPLECPVEISTNVFTAIHKSTLHLWNFCLVLCLLPCSSCLPVFHITWCKEQFLYNWKEDIFHIFLDLGLSETVQPWVADRPGANEAYKHILN